MKTNKAKNRAAVNARLMRAFKNLYHNATPTYPRVEDDKQELFQAWFEDVASSEIDYINDGGAYGLDYRKTLMASCNAGRYASEAARSFYVRNGMRKMREERALWETVREEFGRVYQWGRGGRTLAPENLMDGRSRFKADAFEEYSYAGKIIALRILESLNDYVEAWNRDIPNQWREYLADVQELEEHESNEIAHWAARDVQTISHKGA